METGGNRIKKNYIKLENLEVYKTSFELGKRVFEWVKEFPKTNRFHEGDQLLRSIDSIAANISEGYGRFHYMDKAKFYLNARGSLYESIHWLKVCKDRELINEEETDKIIDEIEALNIKLNNLISSTRNSATK